MELVQTRIFIFYLCLLGLITCSHCVTIVVDGVTEWKHPTISLGDSIIFRNKYHYDLYIYRTRTAFNLCNFTQATLLTNPKSPSYTWRASRVGEFYFSFNPCNHGTKLAIKVVPRPTTAAPAPSVAAPPDFPWPFLPHEKSGGPMSSPELPDGSTFPFINSNPAVPLPASEVDSATVFHLPMTSAINNAAAEQMQMVSLFGYLILVQCILMVMIL